MSRLNLPSNPLPKPGNRGILGRFLAAMLYDTVGPALLATLEPGQFISTLDFKASFLQRAFPGRLVGRGRVVHRDGDIAFLEGSLTNSDEAVVATAAATARVIPIDHRALGEPSTATQR